MIIDIHTHAWPEKVSQKARENLESVFKVPFVGDPTVSTLLRYMDKNNISVSVICAVATRPEQVPSINDQGFLCSASRICFLERGAGSHQGKSRRRKAAAGIPGFLC
jgi:hypothetical protein